MTSLRVVIWVFLLVLALTGCYRQAEGEFQPVEGQNVGPVQNTPEPPTITPTVIVIDPNATATQDTAVQPADVGTPTEDGSALPFDPLASPTLVFIQPGATQELATTIPTFGLPTATEIQPSTFATLATPTTAIIITPQPASAVEFPTFTLEPTEATTPLAATPTALPGQTSSECTYTVKSGDNLFRIAVNNEVDLDELRALNGIVGELIQPGQVLNLPGCTATSATTDTITTAPSGTTSGGIIHTVQNGETLATIASQYGVTINDIVNANSLANPNFLSIGQQLIIPEGQ